MRKSFVFNPNHQYACPQIGRCPHLGGAALSDLVEAADELDEFWDMLRSQLDTARRSITSLLAESQALRKEH